MERLNFLIFWYFYSDNDSNHEDVHLNGSLTEDASRTASILPTPSIATTRWLLLRAKQSWLSLWANNPFGGPGSGKQQKRETEVPEVSFGPGRCKPGWYTHEPGKVRSRVPQKSSEFDPKKNSLSERNTLLKKNNPLYNYSLK